MAKKRAKIESGRLGRALEGRDALIPESHDITTSQRSGVEQPPSPGDVEVKREPTTVRFLPETVKAMTQTRYKLLMERDLKASQSDIIEAAVLSVLSDIDALDGLVRKLQEGSLRVA